MQIIDNLTRFHGSMVPPRFPGPMLPFYSYLIVHVSGGMLPLPFDLDGFIEIQEEIEFFSSVVSMDCGI